MSSEEEEEVVVRRAVRVRRSAAEKRRIVELTLAPGMSVARVAQAEGVNSHQVFQWRRAYRDGGLQEQGSATLLPVVVDMDRMRSAGQQRSNEVREAATVPVRQAQSVEQVGGAIHIELLGRATISVEHGADMGLLRAVLEGLRQ